MSNITATPALTFCFVEQSTAGVLTLHKDTTLASVRAQVQTALQNHLEAKWGVESKIGVVHSEPRSVIIVSDTQGYLSCQDDSKLVSDVCSGAVIALVPSPLQSQKKKGKNKSKGKAPADMGVLAPFLLQSPLLDTKTKHKDQAQSPPNKDDASLALILQRLQQLESTTNELKQSNVELKQEIVGLKQENNNLKQEIVELKEEIVGLKQENNNLKQEIVELKQENNNLKQQVVGLTKRADSSAVQLEQERAARIAEANNHANTNKQLAKLTTENNSLRHQLDVMEETQQDHSEWIYSQDSIMLDRIKARHLLTVAQAKLAIVVGAATPSSWFRAAVAWRDVIGPSDVLSDRLASARDRLKETHVQLDTKTSQFIQSEAGMRLVCDHPSFIRTMGDKAAHPSSNHFQLFRDAVSRHEESEGLTAIMNFVCVN